MFFFNILAENWRHAVNRQTSFPRGMTRRALLKSEKIISMNRLHCVLEMTLCITDLYDFNNKLREVSRFFVFLCFCFC